MLQIHLNQHCQTIPIKEKYIKLVCRVTSEMCNGVPMSATKIDDDIILHIEMRTREEAVPGEHGPLAVSID